ncbi:FprA family A-type flavoprotein [Ammonifex thiophilus]|uniref:FprA family A-type flavoprotein n=1 Tax=Ammonifex thiophilus TaxID=444093 RepID=A0A3D8P7Q8_9THEO|nr:FprA family A-type flavoprotein [Ammonifex thiophilus]RDV84922.1 FprA family A-type flavoprotein [Ammonifex thiophilus]
MLGREIVPGVHAVGAVDWDRRLFDELIPLPNGTTYNAYLIKGSEKTALIDTVDPSKKEELLRNLRKLEVRRLDYVVANHAEQDHSGSLPEVLAAYPEALVVTNAKCKALLIDHLHLPEDRFVVVEDEETLSLGDKTLVFKMAPWVHWPETMFTYLVEDKILFPCDFLGSHFATSELFAAQEQEIYLAAKRYYAEIMMPFRSHVQKHLERVEKLPLAFIAPSHGPVYHHPEFILSAYRDWSSDRVKNEALIVYVSMHDSTAQMVEHLAEALIDQGVKVTPFNLTFTDLGELAMALVDAATVVLGTPTVLGGPHPSALYAAYLVGALRPKTRLAGLIGSYGWGGRTVEMVSELLKPLRAELLEPVLVKGLPREEDLKKLEEMAKVIAQRHREWELLT